jgi:hypothetical protein
VSSSGGGAAGAHGGEPLHRERLWPSPGVWLLPVLLAVFTGIALFPVGAGVAAAGAVLAAALAGAALVRASPVVEVSAGAGLRAGRAVLPARHVAAATPARGERARALRGVELDARTHLVLRGWVDPVVLVALDDPDDPTPAWLVSTRRPEHLAEALRALRAPPRP